MKLELTQKEYRLLLDILHIAEWIMNSYVIEDRPDTENYRRLEQKILSYGDEMGCKGVVDYDEKLGSYFPTREIEEGSAMDFIDEYDEYTFWEELISHLAERDFLDREGLERIRKMSREQRIKMFVVLEEKYHKEFRAHGLDRLVLKKGS